MRYMNSYEIDEWSKRYCGHPVLGPATRTLTALRDAADANSDGWAYWPKPARAAAKLMDLIDPVVDGHYLDQNERYFGNREDATPAKLRKALAPVKAFRTKTGIDFTIYSVTSTLVREYVV